MENQELIEKLSKALQPINDGIVRQKLIQMEVRLREVENRLGIERDKSLLKRCK